MQSSKEEQGEIINPSSAINAKKEENNRSGKTRDLLKKIKDTKGTFHEKMGSIKDRNGMDLTEAEDIKKRWKEKKKKEVGRIHRRTVQKKIFMTQIITRV